MTGEMVNYCKQIVLLSGLEYMNDYNFRALKSLLNHDLKLTKNMQDDYDRINIADLMEEKFPEDAGLSKLIEVCEDIPELAARVDILRKEMEKVKNKTKIKSESSPPPLTSSLMEAWEVEPAMVTASSEESKDTIPESPDTMTTPFLKEKPKIPLLSATSTSQAEGEPLTPQRFPTTASSSLQTPLEPTEISSTILVTSQGSSAPYSTCDKSSRVPPVTASSSIQTIQTCLATSTLPCSHQATLKSPKTEPSSVQATQMTQAIKASGHNCPQVPTAAVSSSFIKPQVTSARLLSGVQTPLMPQATVPSRAQTFRLTPAKMTSGCNSPQMSAATVYSSYSNPHVTPVPSSVQILQMNLAAMTIGCNSPHVSAATVSSHYNNPWVTPATFPGSAQTLQLYPAAMAHGCNSPQVSAATISSSYNNTPQVSSVTVPRSFPAMSLSPATPLKARIGSHLGATDQLVKDHQFEDNEMQNPQSGLWTGLSDQPHLSRTQSCTEKRRKKKEEQPLATKMKRLSLSPPQTTARRVNPMPSWGQLKKLTREAEGLVHRTGNKLSSESMFLAMLALMQSSSEICNYDKAGHSGTSSEK
ncbi:interferon activated gene 213 isoform X3 [Mus musculus]|uniref:Interferon activated gene 213 n=1 Tax=Mus musculus TaxID=10090 RepID=D3Z5G0_MOUSE|nr:interferon activated gene 213 isoform X3 [Mus musculus]|eukprot:XP_011237154.1 PREDICTED: uncharacterized protein LOC623121 isoform X3 [Mus musculus]